MDDFWRAGVFPSDRTSYGRSSQGSSLLGPRSVDSSALYVPPVQSEDPALLPPIKQNPQSWGVLGLHDTILQRMRDQNGSAGDVLVNLPADLPGSRPVRGHATSQAPHVQQARLMLRAARLEMDRASSASPQERMAYREVDRNTARPRYPPQAGRGWPGGDAAGQEGAPRSGLGGLRLLMRQQAAQMPNDGQGLTPRPPTEPRTNRPQRPGLWQQASDNASETSSIQERPCYRRPGSSITSSDHSGSTTRARGAAAVAAAETAAAEFAAGRLRRFQEIPSSNSSSRSLTPMRRQGQWRALRQSDRGPASTRRAIRQGVIQDNSSDRSSSLQERRCYRPSRSNYDLTSCEELLATLFPAQRLDAEDGVSNGSSFLEERHYFHHHRRYPDNRSDISIERIDPPLTEWLLPLTQDRGGGGEPAARPRDDLSELVSVNGPLLPAAEDGWTDRHGQIFAASTNVLPPDEDGDPDALLDSST